MTNRIWERDVPKSVVLREVAETPVLDDSRRRRMRSIVRKGVRFGVIEYKPGRKGFVARFSNGSYEGLSGFGTTVRKAILDSIKQTRTYFDERWQEEYDELKSDKEDVVVKINACQRCGSERVVFTTGRYGQRAMCQACGKKGPDRVGLDASIKAWNEGRTR